MNGDSSPAESGDSFETERVFDAPWQARAFAVAVAMTEEGEYSWDDFQDRLAAEVEQASDGPDDDLAQDETHATEAILEAEAAETAYYERWLAALTRLLVESDTLAAEEIVARTREFAEGERTAEEWIEGERDHVHGDGHDGTQHHHGHHAHDGSHG